MHRHARTDVALAMGKPKETTKRPKVAAGLVAGGPSGHCRSTRLDLEEVILSQSKHGTGALDCRSTMTR